MDINKSVNKPKISLYSGKTYNSPSKLENILSKSDFVEIELKIYSITWKQTIHHNSTNKFWHWGNVSIWSNPKKMWFLGITFLSCHNQILIFSTCQNPISAGICFRFNTTTRTVTFLNMGFVSSSHARLEWLSTYDRWQPYRLREKTRVRQKERERER